MVYCLFSRKTLFKNRHFSWELGKFGVTPANEEQGRGNKCFPFAVPGNICCGSKIYFPGSKNILLPQQMFPRLRAEKTMFPCLLAPLLLADINSQLVSCPLVSPCHSTVTLSEALNWFFWRWPTIFVSKIWKYIRRQTQKKWTIFGKHFNCSFRCCG